MIKTKPYIGDHVLLNLYGTELLTDIIEIQRAIEEAAKEAGAKRFLSEYHFAGEEFAVDGITILTNSHISVHTSPNQKFATLDIFMCGRVKVQNAVDFLIHSFRPKRIQMNLKRGERLIRKSQYHPIEVQNIRLHPANPL